MGGFFYVYCFYTDLSLSTDAVKTAHKNCQTSPKKQHTLLVKIGSSGIQFPLV